MSRTPQDVYASNLLPRSLAYPLRNPRPKNSDDPEGFRVGDVGYIDHNGKFNLVLNISSLPKELQDRCPDFPLGDLPVGEQELDAGDVLTAGVERKNVSEGPRDVYEFTTNRTEGAILILPDGAVRFELQDEVQLMQIRDHVMRYALEWCRFAKRRSLYLVTAAYKSKSWSLGSFFDEPPNKVIFVKRDSADHRYKWTHQIFVDHPVPPENNFFLNQTVLIKGFKMTVRWDWLPIVQRVERTEWWITCFVASLWSTISWYWLNRIAINNVPTSNFSQPNHPLEIINHVLLEKNPGFEVAVTHDNDWIKMIEMGLPPEYLLQENHLREFLVKEHTWTSDFKHGAISLRNNATDRRSPSLSQTDSPQFAIISMRLEGISIDHISAGVCVLVQSGSTTRRTTNKPLENVIEWHDEIALFSSLSFDVTVCSVFQLGSTLGTRNVFAKRTIKLDDLPGNACLIRFSVGEADPCPSLLIMLGRCFSRVEALSSPEEASTFAEETNSGFNALLLYSCDHNKGHLDHAIEHFKCALESEPNCIATALFSLATSKFVKCLAYGTYSKLDAVIKLYEEVLYLRGFSSPDRPATLLLLSQALLSYYGWNHDETIAMRIEYLSGQIDPENSRNLQTICAIMRTHRLYCAMHSGDLTEVDDFIKDLDNGRFEPPYGYFDRPHVLHMLGGACYDRFRSGMDPNYLDKSITLNKEALRLIPDGHDNEKGMVDCFGKSVLKRVETADDLADIDMSIGIAELGERIASALSSTMEKCASVSSEKEQLGDLIALLSAADSVLQFIEQEIPSSRILVFQHLKNEWNGKDSMLARCKKQLGLLLSFLGGEWETKMRELLGELDCHFKKYVTMESTQILQNYRDSFQGFLETNLGTELTRIVLTRAPVDHLTATARLRIRCLICDIIERECYIFEAIVYFQQVKSELAENPGLSDEKAHWKIGFHRRCEERLEKLGDDQMRFAKYSIAADYFSTVLSLGPENRADILIKRARAREAMGSWDEALSDVDEVIKLDPSSDRGHELKHTVLLSAGRHTEANETKVMDLTARSLESPGHPNLADKIIRLNDGSFKQGTFADVRECLYRSEEGMKKIHVAVKTFRSRALTRDQRTGKDETNTVFGQEIGEWEKVDHPNIVPFLGAAYGFGGVGSISLVSLWMTTGTLNTFLGSYNYYLTDAHRLQLLLDISNGLSYLHSLLIIHGDLTLNNVLLGDNCTARLADFGLTPATGGKRERWIWYRLGAMRWVPPEHLLVDNTVYTIKSDIYTLGNIIFTLLSGTWPWSEVPADTAVILSLIRGYKPSRPEFRQIRDAHWALIEHCWAAIGFVTSRLYCVFPAWKDTQCPPSPRPTILHLLPDEDVTCGRPDHEVQPWPVSPRASDSPPLPVTPILPPLYDIVPTHEPRSTGDEHEEDTQFDVYGTSSARATQPSVPQNELSPILVALQGLAPPLGASGSYPYSEGFHTPRNTAH